MGKSAAPMRSHIIVLGLAVALLNIAAGCGSPTSSPGTNGTGTFGVEPDAGTPANAGTDTTCVPPDAGTPTYNGAIIDAPPEIWSWVDFPDSICGLGSTTGLAINPTTRSNDVFIFMNGGGACWDEYTCFGIPGILPPTAQYLSGYGPTEFDNSGYKTMFAVNRTQPTPFKDMSYVFIPYCTGDVHAGDAVQTYGQGRPPVNHKGARNVEAFLNRLVPTFPNATHIFLSGSSGGGFGAQLNYERVAHAFPNAEVHVFADSGQMINPAQGLMSAWLTAWNVTLPACCVGCDGDFSLYPRYLATTYPNRRFALTAYDQDNTLRLFNGLTAAEFQTRTLALLSNVYDPSQNSRYFLLSGTAHTMVRQLDTLADPSGTSLLTFTTNFVNGTNWSTASVFY